MLNEGNTLIISFGKCSDTSFKLQQVLLVFPINNIID